VAELGIDVGRNLVTPNEKILELGVNWVRFPVTPDAPVDELRGRIDHLRRRRVKTAMVIDNSARDGMSNEVAAEFYARAYADIIGAFEIGNEFDAGFEFGPQNDNTAEGRRNKRIAQFADVPDWQEPSWIMDPEEVSALLRAFRDRMPGIELWSGGLVCGQPEFLDLPGLDLSPADRIAIHPYDKGGIDAGKLLDRYVEKLRTVSWDTSGLGRPRLVASEFGWPSAGGSPESEDEQGRMVDEIANALADHPHVAVAILFCYDNDQDIGGFGLIGGGRIKPAFNMYQQIAMGRPGASGLFDV
jgi:hypothetical protein